MTAVLTPLFTVIASFLQVLEKGVEHFAIWTDEPRLLGGYCLHDSGF